MNRYVALIRGINVSGQKKIIMKDLRALLTALGFQQVQTYIQSGNIVFGYRSTPSEVLESMIIKKIHTAYGFEVSVFVKTPSELGHILQHNPFIVHQKKDPERAYVTLLNAVPGVQLVSAIDSEKYLPEEFILDGKNIYFYSPDGYGNAKMNNNFFEKKLEVSATTRNWRTMTVLFEMASRATIENIRP